MLFIRFAVLSLCLLCCMPAHAEDTQKISLEDVLRSSADNFPQIQIALAKYEETQGKINESLGAFDASIEGSYYDRLSGFYSGRTYGAELVQPFQQFNAKASVGYRRSDDNFPIYEDYYFTNDGGELSGKLSLSLLRNRDIDPKRFKVLQNQINLEQAELNVVATKISVQSDAYQTYLDWVSTGLKYKVYKSLLKIAENRQKALTQKEKRGDIAKIALVENRQFILQRKEVVRQTKRQFENISNKLSMYMRGPDGEPFLMELSNLPSDLPSHDNVSIGDMNDALGEIVSINPKVRQLENEMKQAQNQIALGQNDMQPALDVEVGVANDFGSGSRTRDDLDSTLRLNMSFPLQRRSGEGQVRQGQARKRQVEQKRNLELERLRVSFENILSNVAAAQDLLDITEEEISVTQQMENAERKRFDNGQSDFFLVNIREINAVTAKINNIKASQYLSSVYADYLVATLDIDRLGLTD